MRMVWWTLFAVGPAAAADGHLRVVGTPSLPRDRLDAFAPECRVRGPSRTVVIAVP